MDETLGRYKIIREIGRGAMGIVYQGYDPKIDRTVALKTIRKDRLAESRDVEDLLMRFQRELRATGKLVHPNIISVYDTGEDEENAYIAMEYIEGDTLEDLIQRGTRFPVEKIIDIIDKICDGLEYTHRQGIVHRDLKPSNIMLVEGEGVKITDFGISKAIGAASSPLTQAGVLLGTPSYMSPEQITGNEIDGRSDLFSVGIILYQLLTGEKPFVGDTIPTLLYHIVNKDPTPPSQIDSTIAGLYDEVIAKALAKDPDKRYETARDFVEDLKRAYRGEALMKAPNIETTMTVAEKAGGEISPKQKRYWLLAGFVILILALIAGGYYWIHRRPRIAKEEESLLARPEQLKAFGSIVVKSDPPNAQVFIDGKLLENLTPTVIGEVPAGEKHEIRVEKKGFRPWSGSVEAQPDTSMPIQATLEKVVLKPPLSGEVRITSEPSGADVYLNNKDMARKTPTRISGLSLGKRYKLRLKKEGYRIWEGEVNLHDSKPLSLQKVELEEAYGELNLHVSPWADVYHKGKKLGTTPMAPIRLQEGVHKLILKNPLLNIKKPITVKIMADKVYKEIVDISEGMKGKLKINVRPWAYVYVDGKEMGITPLEPLELMVGEHIVLVKNDKLAEERSFRIMIKANEVISRKIDLLKKE